MRVTPLRMTSAQSRSVCRNQDAALASLARGRMKTKHAALVEALTGKFDDHHAELARMLLDQVDALNAQIGKLTARIGELIAAIPAAQGTDADGTTGPSAGAGPGAAVLPAAARLDEVTGIGPDGAQAIRSHVTHQTRRVATQARPRPTGSPITYTSKSRLSGRSRQLSRSLLIFLLLATGLVIVAYLQVRQPDPQDLRAAQPGFPGPRFQR